MSRSAGFKHTKETLAKMSAAQKGKKLVSSNFAGKSHTLETKNKMSIASRKRWGKEEEHIKVSGKNSKFWSGGVSVDIGGYVIINRKREHRIVMENHIGRKLTKLEVVHHIDGDRSNNAIENLMLFATQAEHLKHHAKLRKLKNATTLSGVYSN